MTVNKLEITVHSANNVINVEKYSESDPFVKIKFRGKKKETKHIDDNLNPTWDENIYFDLEKPLEEDEEIEIKIYDYETVGINKELGRSSLKLREFINLNNPIRKTLNMYTTKNKPLDTTLDLTIFYNTKGKMSKTSEDPPLEEVEIEDNTKEIVTVENGIPIKKPKKEKIITNNNREKFSNGAQDFQIKIKIIEAKNLFGSNISPLTVVTYANMHKRTKIIKSNNNPKWNEIIYFNVNKKATDLFDDVLKIKVVNSKKFRKNSVIGEFKCDIGRIVDQDSMCFINKWIALVDPEMSQSSSKGYLKICSAVISSKFSAPKFPESNMNDDVENNLLIPTGVVFETISLSIRIFDAEDLPTMDSSIMGSIKKTILGKETKPFCDPFLLCSFGGFAKKTPIFYNTYNPSWNCQINFSIKFPSMCDFLKIQLYDWDQIGKNDLIATSMLRLSDLSDLGDEENEGYPPTFGPAFVNFYGGPRKFNISSDDYDDMNNAITEGCGYRGRVFMEIQTNINENSITEVPPEDVNINHKYKSKSEFVLNAVLFNASLLKKIGEPITVEISIGNYGNSLDPLVLPSNSTSQPMGTIYDGSKYYFLPWENENPIFRIICEWEDVVHRLYTINFFLKASIIIEEKLSILNKELKKLKISRINRRQSYTEHSNSVCLLIADLAELVISIFNEKLPTCGENGHTTLNNLDQVLYQKRCFEMKHIVYQANEILKKTTKITKDEDLTWLIKELKSINTKIIYLTQDPQNQIPDIIFWIIAGKERISYARFPAHSFIYHQNEIFRGSNCGIVKTILLKKPIKNTSSITRHITGILRCQMWFGLVNQENNWIDVLAKQGSVTVTAETYQNEICILGKWISNIPTRPKWSDITGELKLKKESFSPPNGWEWSTEWDVKPSISSAYSEDAGYQSYIEEVFLNEYLSDTGEWVILENKVFTDVNGKISKSPKEIDEVFKKSKNWMWSNDWMIDKYRAVDPNGWEYCIDKDSDSWVSSQRMYHYWRRKRLIRTRVRKENSDPYNKDRSKQSNSSDSDSGNWEYSLLFTTNFHRRKKSMDVCRRRRWKRDLIRNVGTSDCRFLVKNEDDDKVLYTPSVYLRPNIQMTAELRIYLCQARGLKGLDESGLADPYTRVSFLNKTAISKTVEKSITPKWRQTLIISQIQLFQNVLLENQEKPRVYVEIYDKDQLGRDEFLGFTEFIPLIKTEKNINEYSQLNWYNIHTSINDMSEINGQILISADLLVMQPENYPTIPPKIDSKYYVISSNVEPNLKLYRIEILCWGVRNMKKFQLTDVTSPSVKFEIDGTVIEFEKIKDIKKQLNFSNPHITQDIMLPEVHKYIPPLNIKVYDNRSFGRKPCVGIHSVLNIEEFIHNPDNQILKTAQNKDEKVYSIINMDPDTKQLEKFKKKELTKIEKEEIYLKEVDLSWWCKYLNSDTKIIGNYLNMGFEKMTNYNNCLEENFDNFNDFCNSLALYTGKSSSDKNDDQTIGELNAKFFIYPIEKNPNIPPKIDVSSLPVSKIQEFLIRVYIIKATELTPSDNFGKADPYIKIKIGNKRMENVDNHEISTLNPTFGSFFELNITMPLQKDLTVIVKDYDLISKNDTIGQTKIDLEKRYLSKYYGTVGVAKSYCTSGVNKWRDTNLPYNILKILCARQNIKKPSFDENMNTLQVSDVVFSLNDIEDELNVEHQHFGESLRERLAIHAINTLSEQNVIKVVPEHVEIRTLYNPDQPGIPQGYIHLWVDMFNLKHGTPPPPICIKKIQPKEYELRVCIYGTVDMHLDETSITGEKMSDVYIKGWISEQDETQKTDVHYRCLDGQASFNWRFKFPFEYISSTSSIVIKKKEHFWNLNSAERQVEPTFIIQAWDNDVISRDDYLGSLEMHLNNLPPPAKSAKVCNIKQLNKKRVSLFKNKRLRGFWPIFDKDDNNNKICRGKIEMEMEIVDKNEIIQKPCGNARDEPNQYPKLEPPNRPATSFCWYTSPIKTLIYIWWKRFKYPIIFGILIVLFIFTIAYWLYCALGESASIIFK